MNVEATDQLPVHTRLGTKGADESTLIRRAKRGSREAFEEIFRRNWRPAYRAAYLVVGDLQAAEDIAQEAILAAIRHLELFDGSRPFGPWLHRITVNRAIDWARANRLRPMVGIANDIHERSSDEVAPQLSDDVLEAILALPEEHRAVVALRYVLGYTPGEIADLLEIPRGTVNSRLRRALDGLRAQFGEGDGR